VTTPPLLAASATQVLDYLQGRWPSLQWALSRAVDGAHEVLCPAAQVDVGPVIGPVIDPVIDPAVVDEPARPVRPIRRLVTPDGEELGALWALAAAAPPEHVENTLDEPLLDVLANLLAALLQADQARLAAARRSQVLHEQALSDELTGLLNRRGWTQVLEVEPASPPTDVAPSVLVIDLDRLKEVNDVQGHVAGDEYLQLAAATLAAVCREGDLVARLGGDEFGVLVEPSHPAAADRLVERVREAFAAAGVAASIGRAAYDTDGGLLRTWWRADQAMYAEKRRRGATRGSAVVLA
jgi:diguanylate cyclase (GGDEF)-like protein